MHDNEYIKRGYRINFKSKKLLAKSLFMVHNESVNVWTHLLGVFIFIALIMYTFIYLAPPGLYRSVTDPVSYRWLTDVSHAKEKAGSFYSDIANAKL